jgi:hypothetical protein
VVAFQTYRLTRLPPPNQKLYHATRVGASVHVVAKEDLDRARDWIPRQVRIDLRQDSLKKISPAMHVADCINTRPSRKAWCRSPSC